MIKIKFISRKKLFDGFVGIDELKFKIPEKNKRITRTVVTRPFAVAILLYNKSSRKIILIKQFRAAVYHNDNKGFVLEVPAGVIEECESPLDTVIRETLEETGYKIEQPKLITSFYPTTGFLSEIIHLYFAVVENKDKIGAGGGLDTESEYLEVVEMPVEQAFDLLDKGLIEDAKTLISIQYLRSYLNNMKI